MSPFDVVVYAATFKLQPSKTHDTFLQTDVSVKGIAFLNGFNLGRYWPLAGPQKTLYVPKTLFREENILVLVQLEEGKRTISIIWTPSHTETEVRGNARAHHLAREEASARAVVSGDEDPEERLDPPTPLTIFRSITKHYREQRHTLPPPHHLLDKREQVKCGLLQSNTYPTPPRMNLLYPQLYPSPACPNCQQARGTIYHMVLACPNHPAPQDAARLRDHPNPWKTAIRASDAEGLQPTEAESAAACDTSVTADPPPELRRLSRSPRVRRLTRRDRLHSVHSKVGITGGRKGGGPFTTRSPSPDGEARESQRQAGAVTYLQVWALGAVAVATLALPAGLLLLSYLATPDKLVHNSTSSRTENGFFSVAIAPLVSTNDSFAGIPVLP
ncbi:hypothetical protein HPB48_005327 [Haemaphysalis longicornis]|uniref:Beta-galactosidase galactose-binding domain-containing protein n=1 Tax=Haemaphysalis longicornis TaxID=44386 RepID=A0A9J6GF70_HAELO|nr:hypothetical protein HPB48_005327 [Haemaphysalis longicornis]